MIFSNDQTTNNSFFSLTFTFVKQEIYGRRKNIKQWETDYNFFSDSWNNLEIIYEIFLSKFIFEYVCCALNFNAFQLMSLTLCSVFLLVLVFFRAERCKHLSTWLQAISDFFSSSFFMRCFSLELLYHLLFLCIRVSCVVHLKYVIILHLYNVRHCITWNMLSFS